MDTVGSLGRQCQSEAEAKGADPLLTLHDLWVDNKGAANLLNMEQRCGQTDYRRNGVTMTISMGWKVKSTHPAVRREKLQYRREEQLPVEVGWSTHASRAFHANLPAAWVHWKFNPIERCSATCTHGSFRQRIHTLMVSQKNVKH